MAAIILCKVTRATTDGKMVAVEIAHDPVAMHMSGCNYQKDFSFCSWQKTLFIFVIGTTASITGPKAY
jgi:hypothetical protein